MKFNWGTGIVLTIIAFICFIMYFVIRMSTGHKYQYDLVTEKYYQKELGYQVEIDAVKNAYLFQNKIKTIRTSKGLKIILEKDFPFKEVTGKVFLYRPSNKQLDFEISFSFSNTYLLVPEERLADGRWNIEISWNLEKKTYLIKKKIRY